MKKLLLTTAALALGATVSVASAKAAPACDANVSQAGQVCITGMTPLYGSGGCVYVATTYAPWGWAALDFTSVYSPTALTSTSLSQYVDATAGIQQVINAFEQSRIMGHGIGLTVGNANGHCGGAYIIQSWMTE